MASPHPKRLSNLSVSATFLFATSGLGNRGWVALIPVFETKGKAMGPQIRTVKDVRGPGGSHQGARRELGRVDGEIDLLAGPGDAWPVEDRVADLEATVARQPTSHGQVEV